MNKIFCYCLVLFIVSSCFPKKPGELVVENEIVELDNLKVGVEHTIPFKIKNQGEEELSIFSVIGSCYCIKPNIMDTIVIEPQKEVIIEINVLRDFNGSFYEDFYISSSDKKSSPKQIIVKGYATNEMEL